MNARRYLLLLVIVSVIILAPQLALSQVPTLWSKCLAAASQVFPMYAWHSVEEVLAKASKQEIDEFAMWTPEPAVIDGDIEDTFLFLWARIDDKGEADIRQLDSKRLPWSDTASPGLIKLRTTCDHDLLLRFFRSIESDGRPDPFDIGVIRCLGLVPFKYIDETIAELRKYCHETSPELKKYCDPSSQKPEATGIYGEEMFEVLDMLEYRNTRAPSSVSQ